MGRIAKYQHAQLELMTPREKAKPIRLSRTDAAYIAGLLDGEGTIYLKRHDRSFQVHVTITNTFLPVILWLRDKCGGAIFEDRPQMNALAKKVGYRWYIPAASAGALLKQLEPFLKIKRARALIALEYRSRQEAYLARYKNAHLTEDEVAAREALRQRMMLN